MFIIGYFLQALATVINMVLYAYMIILVARAVLSWVNPDPYNALVRFVYNVTDPLLDQIRRRVPVVFGGIDFSVFIVLLVIAFLNTFLVSSLYHMAAKLI